MRAAGALVGNNAFGGLLVSSIAMVVALVLLHRLVARDLGPAVASRTILYLALAPTAFFLLAPYPEALFLALSVGVFLAARRGRFLLAGALAALAVLCRAQGLLLLAPLAVELALELRRRGRPHLPGFAALALPLATYAAYHLWVRGMGFPGGPAEVHTLFWGSTFGDPLETLRRSLAIVAASLSSRPFEVLNLAAVTVAALSVPLLVLRRLPWSYVAYTAANVLAMLWRESAFTPLLSADRFIVVVFPVFVLLALAGGRAWVDRFVLASFAPLQAVMFFHYAQYMFVG
jgi:hypothetical protein